MTNGTINVLIIREAKRAKKFIDEINKKVKKIN